MIEFVRTFVRATIKAAALQFSLAHPASTAIIPGASRRERIAESMRDGQNRSQIYP